MYLLQDHIGYSYEAPAYTDSDSQSSSSQYQEYHDSPSPSSDRGDRKDLSMPLVPLSGTHTNFNTPALNFYTILMIIRVFTAHPLPLLQERGRSVCSSSSLRCSRLHRCGAVSGGSSPLLARFSSLPKTKSNWRSCGGGGRVIARPWPIRKWPGRWEITLAPVRFRRWRGSSPTGLMRRHSEAYKETLAQCRKHESVSKWKIW